MGSRCFLTRYEVVLLEGFLIDKICFQIFRILFYRQFKLRLKKWKPRISGKLQIYNSLKFISLKEREGHSCWFFVQCKLPACKLSCRFKCFFFSWNWSCHLHNASCIDVMTQNSDGVSYILTEKSERLPIFYQILSWKHVDFICLFTNSCIIHSSFCIRLLWEELLGHGLISVLFPSRQLFFKMSN